jgi:nucleoid-associated protein YgaU
MDNDEPGAEEIFVQADPIGHRQRTTMDYEEQVVEEDISEPETSDVEEPEFTINDNPWINNHATVEDNHTENYYTHNYYDPEYESTPDNTEDSSSGDNIAVTIDDSQEDERLRLDLPTPVWVSQEVDIESSNSNDDNGIERDAPINPPVKAFKQTTYVIQKGDNNLAKIAKKFYGETEGNRIVNINKIYEANKKTLKSPDKIFIGQKLIIPKPAPPVKPQPSEILGGSMFQNVQSVGGTNRSNNLIRNNGKWYVVKENDSLWKIAAEQLGSGARFEEISKLNVSILTDKNKLKPGMKLLLPKE